jgi:ABC-type Co2+ transport system permease subunit
METLLLWAFIAYGMTSILVWGSIFENQRQWIKSKSKFLGDLISCTLCTSTWVGFFMSLTLGGLMNFFDVHWVLVIFYDGMFTAGIVWAINSVVEYFEENRIK